MLFQYEQIDNLDLPYGVVMYPKTDWNTAFSGDGKILTDLAAELYESGVGVRCVEAGSLPSLYRQLSRLDNKYNADKNNKIKFGILGGHGTRSSILLGGSGKPGSKLTSEQLYHVQDYQADNYDDWDGVEDEQTDNRYQVYVDRIREYFVDNASLVLISCSTGEDGGIARSITDKYGFVASAPNCSTNIRKIDIDFDGEGKVILMPLYKKGECKTYMPL